MEENRSDVMRRSESWARLRHVLIELGQWVSPLCSPARYQRQGTARALGRTSTRVLTPNASLFHTPYIHKRLSLVLETLSYQRNVPFVRETGIKVTVEMSNKRMRRRNEKRERESLRWNMQATKNIIQSQRIAGECQRRYCWPSHGLSAFDTDCFITLVYSRYYPFRSSHTLSSPFAQTVPSQPGLPRLFYLSLFYSPHRHQHCVLNF